MSTALAEKSLEEHIEGEQRIVLTGVSWEEYEAMRAALENHPGIRMFYLQGNLEIMSPSPAHEFIKTAVGRLLERYAEERDIPLQGFGSTTFRDRAKQRGLEPDECYVFDRLKEVPDIAIEVTLTSGGLDKLEIYRGLGIPEVWFWKQDMLLVFRLRGDRYEQLERSEFLPELDLARLAEYASWPDQHRAVKAFVAALRGG